MYSAEYTVQYTIHKAALYRAQGCRGRPRFWTWSERYAGPRVPFPPPGGAGPNWWRSLEVEEVKIDLTSRQYTRQYTVD